MSIGKTICTVCNYIYDETLGDAKSNVPPSVPFNSLDESWLCPDCGASKDMFQSCSCVTLSAPTIPDALSSKTVGELVTSNPSYARVFEAHNIDYCCGGKRPLIEICQEKNIDVNLLLQKLNAVDALASSSDEPNWSDSTLRALTDHIVEVYHFPLRDELTRIERLANKIATVHGDNHPEMQEVAKVFADFKTQLELHMQKEELILFPAIVRQESGENPQLFGCGGGIENPISVMLQEHDDAGDALKTMRALTHDYAVPADGCNTFRVLIDALKNLEFEMHQHVHKENNILFPRALSLTKPEPLSCK